MNMKAKKILMAACAASLLLASCGGNSGESKGLADYKDATAADSLLYYFGQLRAVDYWQYAKTDSTMKSEESRAEYLKGLRAGLDATRDNDAYNQGYYVGLQLAMNMKEFTEGYGTKFNKQVLIDAITDGLRNDSVVDVATANNEFRRVLDNLNQQKEEKDRNEAKTALEKDAKSNGWTKVNDNLYAGKSNGGQGALIKPGDRVDLSVSIGRLGGETLDSRDIHGLVVGSNFAGPVTDAILTMKIGEKKTFYTTAPAFFGRAYERFNVKANEILVLNVGVAPSSEKAIAPADSTASTAR